MDQIISLLTSPFWHELVKFPSAPILYQSLHKYFVYFLPVLITLMTKASYSLNVVKTKYVQIQKFKSASTSECIFANRDEVVNIFGQVWADVALLIWNNDNIMETLMPFIIISSLLSFMTPAICNLIISSHALASKICGNFCIKGSSIFRGLTKLVFRLLRSE